MDTGTLFEVLTDGYQPPRMSLNINSPDPTPPFGLAWAERMMIDPQVGLGMAINAAPIMKAKIQLSGSSDVVQFANKEFRDLWMFALPKIVEAFYLTISGGEMVYERDQNGMVCFKEYRDIYPVDLRILHKNFNYRGLQVSNTRSTQPGAKSQNTYLLGPKSFLYVHKRRYGGWEGRSDLRPAFKHWLSRADFNGADASARIWYYKNSFGGGVVYHPKGDYIDKNGRRIPHRELALQMGTMITNGQILAFESIIDPDTKQQTWQWEPPKMNGSGKDLLEYIDHIDVRIHRGMGIPDDILSQQSGTGSYAGRTIPLSVFGISRNQVLREVFFALKNQVVDPLIRLNFGPKAVHAYDVQTIEVDMDALMPSGPGQAGEPQSGLQGQQPGMDENGQPLNLDEPPPGPDKKTQQFGDAEHPRAPKNGVVIGGKKYEGGEFIPATVLAGLTPEQRNRLADAMEEKPSTNSQRSIIDININDNTPESRPVQKSAAFYEWFGSSQVVDDNGEPLVVYHGTSGDFDQFDEGKTIKGVFASDSSIEAARFGDSGEGTHSLKPLYMRIENPKVIDMRGQVFDFKKVNARVIAARNDGNDGVIVRNVRNFPDSKPSTTYIALSPNQLKSATANSGKYSRESASLTDNDTTGSEIVSVEDDK